MERKAILTDTYDSPSGTMVLGEFRGKLCMADWAIQPRHDHVAAALLRDTGAAGFAEGHTSLLDRAATELDEYFAGQRQSFDIPLLQAGNCFRLGVWLALRRIPFGATVSYAELAADTGNPKAARAVASAVGANPLSIIVPCHRVIGSDGSLRGYAGGLEAKRQLLALENIEKNVIRL